MNTNNDVISMQILNLGSLSQIITFFDIKKTLSLRKVCKGFNKAVCYGWKIRITELEHSIKNSQDMISSHFDPEIVKKHFQLKESQKQAFEDIDRYAK